MSRRRAFGPAVRPATQSVLDDVADERGRQIEQYGENDDLEYGTGPDVIWLAPFSWEGASDVELGFREDYEVREARTGRPTWIDLLREELAEVAKEDDPARLRAEAIQVAALAVSMCERLDRDAAALRQAHPGMAAHLKHPE